MQNDEQFEYWNGPEGQHWVDRDTLFDAMLAPFVEPRARRRRRRGRPIGSSTSAAATAPRAAPRRGAPTNGRVVGVDISAPMLARARERAADEGVAQRRVRARRRAGPRLRRVRHVRRDDQPLRRDVLRRSGRRLRQPRGARCGPAAASPSCAGRRCSPTSGSRCRPRRCIPIVGPPDCAAARRARARSRSPTATACSGILDATPGFTNIDARRRARCPLLLGGGLPLDEAVAFLGEGGMGKRFLGDADAPDPATGRWPRCARRSSRYATAEGVRLDSAVWLVQASR